MPRNTVVLLRVRPRRHRQSGMAWRGVADFLRRFLGCPSDFVRSFPEHDPVMVMCFLRYGNVHALLRVCASIRLTITGSSYEERQTKSGSHSREPLISYIVRPLGTWFFVTWYFTWLLPQAVCRGRRLSAGPWGNARHGSGVW